VCRTRRHSRTISQVFRLRASAKSTSPGTLRKCNSKNWHRLRLKAALFRPP
jgi:hypothetical protein